MASCVPPPGDEVVCVLPFHDAAAGVLPPRDARFHGLVKRRIAFVRVISPPTNASVLAFAKAVTGLCGRDGRQRWIRSHIRRPRQGWRGSPTFGVWGANRRWHEWRRRRLRRQRPEWRRRWQVAVASTIPKHIRLRADLGKCGGDPHVVDLFREGADVELPVEPGLDACAHRYFDCATFNLTVCPPSDSINVPITTEWASRAVLPNEKALVIE